MKIIVLLVLTILLSLGQLTAETVNIEKAVKTALEQNEDVKIAKEDLKNSKYRYDEAFSGALPRVTGDLTYLNRTWVSEELFDPGYKEHTLSAEIKIIQPIWLGGKVGTAVDIAKVYEKLSKKQFQLSQDEVVLNTKSSFYSILLAKEALRVMLLVKNDADENLKRIEIMFKNGLASEYDYLKAKVRVNSLNPQIEEIKNNVHLAEDNLKSIMGIDYNTDVDFNDKLPEFTGFEDIDYRTIALSNRKELKLLEDKIEMLRLNQKIVFSNHLPNVVALGTWSHTGTAEDLGDNFDTDLTLRKINLGLNVSIPIYSGGETTAKVDQAKIEVKKAEYELQKTRRMIELQVQQIINEIKKSIVEIKLHDESIEESEKSLIIANVRYESGLGTQLEVIDAQTAVQQAKLSRIQALNTFVVKNVELEYATGTIKY